MLTETKVGVNVSQGRRNRCANFQLNTSEVRRRPHNMSAPGRHNVACLLLRFPQTSNNKTILDEGLNSVSAF